MIEVNPAHGTQTSIFSSIDSSKYIYGAGELSGFTELNGRLYFGAHNTANACQLWSTDGTQEGTTLVKEISATSTLPIGGIIKVGNRVVFMASETGDYNNYDLWASDGTESGTIKIAELDAYSNTLLDGQQSAVLGNHMAFNSGNKIFVTDGTEAGTIALMNYQSYSQANSFFALNNKLHFMLADSTGKLELWGTNGTLAGTIRERQLTVVDSINYVAQMMAFDGNIYITALKQGDCVYSLLALNGNLSQPAQRVDLSGGAFQGQLFSTYKGALYFAAYDTVGYNVFRISAGNPIAQRLITEGGPLSYIYSITFANNSAYFVDGNSNSLIHRIDLTTLAHTVTELPGMYITSYSLGNDILVGTGGKVYFAAYDTAVSELSFIGKQLFVVASEDLQTINVVMPAGECNEHPFDFISGCGVSDIFDFKVWNDKIIVPANFNNAGRELWIYSDGLASDVLNVKNDNPFLIYPNPADKEVTVKTHNVAGQRLDITDMHGKTVLKTALSADITTLNVSSLTSGNYCVSLIENGRVTNTKKLMVVR